MKSMMNYGLLAAIVMSFASVCAEGNLTDVTTSGDFNAKVLQSSRPVVVKFFAVWCGACKSMKPVIDSIAGENSSSYDFIAVNVDAGKALADKYNITGLPTLVFFKDGKEVGRRVGTGSKSEVVAAIKKSLG